MATSANPLSSLSGLANPSGAGLDPEPIAGNSLTSFIRGIEGLTGSQGQGVLGAGLGETQTGLGLVNPGLAQANTGTAAAAPALGYLTQLVKGDQADVSQAAAPEVDQISQQFDAIRNMVSQQPRGGGKASVLAEAPFQKATAINQTEAQLRSGAAGQLGSLATNLAGVGLGEANVGLGAAGLGLEQEQIGSGLEGESANIALTKEGQDYQQASAFSQLLSGVNTFI